MNNELKKAYTIATAGLFHDIGKLLQRVGLQLEKFGYDLHYLKNNKYYHAAYTSMFFNGKMGSKNYDSVFKSFVGLDDNDISSASLVNLAANHHNPENAYQWIIAEADRLASGFERVKNEPDVYENYLQVLQKHEQEVLEKATFKNTLLRNIFSEINLEVSESHKSFDSFYPLETLNPDITPKDMALISKTDAAKDYTALLEGMLNDLVTIELNISSYSIENLYLTLCSLLERYCWCVPASTVRKDQDGKFIPETSTISLYDHMRTTSAVASALYSYHSSVNKFDIESIKKRDISKFCFIQGDFSGIQDFIFDSGGESNKSAAKILRAKSFFVSMATEAAAYAICDELNVPYSSIVMNAGGKFTIITGNTEKARGAVKKFRKEINTEFKRLTFGQTRFNIVGVPFSPEHLTGDKFKRLIEKLSHELEKQKLRPVIEEHVFENYITNKGLKDLCNICGKHWGYGDDGYCDDCRKFIKIGNKLVKEEFVQLSDSGEFKLFGGWDISFGKESSKKLIFDISAGNEFNGMAKKRIGNYVPRFQREENQNQKYSRIELDKRNSESAGSIKTFHHLACDSLLEDENGFRGTANLAVLKADVDSLGQMFSRGLQNNNISKTATLSRMLDYFFTGWLQKEINGKDIYTVFSGGDDLFLIGAWDQIVELAGKIAERLKAYSGGNPDVHLSAGIVLRKPMIPVREMAEDAEEALSAAKNGDGLSDNRNRINIFGITAKWDDFLAMQSDTERLRILYSHNDGNNIAHGFSYRLLDFAAKAELIDKADGIINSSELLEAAKWQARFRYLLARNYKNKECFGDVEKLGEMITKYKIQAKIPLSIVIYENRRK